MFHFSYKSPNHNFPKLLWNSVLIRIFYFSNNDFHTNLFRNNQCYSIVEHVGVKKDKENYDYFVQFDDVNGR